MEGFVYCSYLMGDVYSPTLQKTVPDFIWGSVYKRQTNEKFHAYHCVMQRMVGQFYHKTSAKKALIASVVEHALNK